MVEVDKHIQQYSMKVKRNMRVLGQQTSNKKHCIYINSRLFSVLGSMFTTHDELASKSIQVNCKNRNRGQ